MASGNEEKPQVRLAYSGIASPEIETWLRQCGDVLNAALVWVDCPRCAGTGFSGLGTGYDDVCSECGGLRQMPVDLRKSTD